MGVKIEHRIPRKIREILENGNFSDDDKDLILRAYLYARQKHEGQFRRSGEPYISHPVEVARILHEIGMDAITISAGLLHDVLEDCDVEYEVLKENFGEGIARIVDGVTKITKLDFNIPDTEARVETIRKMIVAMATDIRVILVKLADRLHNMRTLQFLDERKQKEKSLETLTIYAPISHRLGIHILKWELEDLAFKYLYPEEYRKLKIKVAKKLDERRKITEEYKEQLLSFLKENGINCKIDGRVKHFYSIWQKMKKKGKSFDEIYDLIALRIIVKDEVECYKTLGVVHSLWSPLPGRIKDYIATPKSNGYRALHTTVITQHGEPLEIQIRSVDMHEEAEYGLAAHWRYKEGVPFEKYKWVERLVEWQRDYLSGVIGLSDLQKELVMDEVYVFTPKGEVKHLPRGATTIDFAYSIHTEIGHHYAGAKVNGKLVPIDYKLQNGDVVEIIVNKNSPGPSLDWLRYAASSRTKAKIRRFFKEKHSAELMEKGRELLRKVAKRLNRSIDSILEDEIMRDFMVKNSLKSEKDLFVRLGEGCIGFSNLISLFSSKEKEKTKERERKRKRDFSDVYVEGMKGVEVRFAKCCSPIPGDEIIGVVTRNNGISVHTINCENVRRMPKNLLVSLRWAENSSGYYTTWIGVEAGNGFSTDAMIENLRKLIMILEINTKIQDDGTSFHILKVKVRGRDELEEAMNEVRKMKGVKKVVRMRRR